LKNIYTEEPKRLFTKETSPNKLLMSKYILGCILMTTPEGGAFRTGSSSRVQRSFKAI